MRQVLEFMNCIKYIVFVPMELAVKNHTKSFNAQTE